MKNLKRTPHIFQASNVTLDTALIEARSYRHWVFVKVIQGKVVFNAYRYSNTTSKHQWKVRSLMQQLNIKIDLTVEVREGLNDHRNVKALVKTSDEQIKQREENRKGKQRAKRVYKKLCELGLFNLNGQRINVDIETKNITGFYAY